jgi:uncharacterized protein
MNTLNFLDANVWLALIWSRHVHSERAKAWFAQAGEEQFFFCRFTQMTVLGSSQPTPSWERTRKPCPKPGVCGIESGPTIALPSCQPNDLEKEFRSRSRLTTRSPKVWVDAYLLAFSAVAGLKFVAFDHALQSRAADVLVL